jgi:phenylacetate-CoA ligase
MTGGLREAAVASWDELRRGVRDDALGGAMADLARLRWNRDQILAEQRRGLARLLAHAAEHSPFHARRLRDIDLGAVDPCDMSALPVMTKADMMSAFDDVLTDRRLRRADVEAALGRAGAAPVPLLGRYVALASGGSSGMRGVFVLDREALASFISATARPPASESAPVPPQGVVASITAPSAAHATAMLVSLTACEGWPVRFHLMPATRPLAAIVDELNEVCPTILTGYASMLARLAAEARAGRLRIRPVMIAPTSETLLPEMRSAIREAFGVPVVDGFACTEGLTGKAAPDDDTFAFNTDMCIVEFVDADNRPTPIGVPADKVLVTNLHNLVQPLIRYELNDRFVPVADADGHGHLRARVQGRSDEVLRYPDGTVIHPIVIRSAMVATPQIADYQVVQTPRGVDVTLVAATGLAVDAFVARLSRALADAGLHLPHVGVRLVEQLDRNPLSGKFRRFVPLP